MSDNMQFRLLLNNLVLVGFFYFNAYLLYPLLQRKRGLAFYIGAAVLSVFLLISLTRYVEREYLPFRRNDTKTERSVNSQQLSQSPKGPPRKHWDGRGPFLYYLILPYIFIIGISLSYRIVRDSSRREKLRKEKENETLKTELTFLRSQVSPHFMFNVLNTLVSMARKKSDMMEPSLIKLSNLMRYMLYESNDEKISLEQEIQYLKSYIDLQLLRFGDDLILEMDIERNVEGFEIEPMLLIAFVENAFKHGVGMVENPFINITLRVDPQTSWLTFLVENSISPVESSKDRSSGIGLNNMRRRLELLYTDRYKLETREKDGIFVSDLRIRLK